MQKLMNNQNIVFMYEELKENKKMSSDKFVKPYGSKKEGANYFAPEMDVTDQRSPVTTPDDAFAQMFFPDENTMEELVSETINDFDSDIYDYEDRGELGEDIALSQQPEIVKRAPALKKSPKQQ